MFDEEEKRVMQVLAVALCNPSMLHQFCSSRLDLGSVVQEKATDVCYSRLLVSLTSSPRLYIADTWPWHP